jgi:hypothetical protein
MRLDLHPGYRPLQRLILRVMRAIIGQVPGPVAMMSYRKERFGQGFAALTHEALRGPSRWTVAERELFSAFVSRLNRCEY